MNFNYKFMILSIRECFHINTFGNKYRVNCDNIIGYLENFLENSQCRLLQDTENKVDINDKKMICDSINKSALITVNKFNHPTHITYASKINKNNEIHIETSHYIMTYW